MPDNMSEYVAAAKAAELRNQVQGIVEHHCVRDHWNGLALRCSKGKLADCVAHLTPDQKAKLNDGLHSVSWPPVPPPTVTMMEPTEGDAGRETEVVLRGSGFTRFGFRTAKVRFGSELGIVVVFKNDSELVIKSLGGQANNTVDVVVEFDPGGEVKVPGKFRYVPKP